MYINFRSSCNLPLSSVNNNYCQDESIAVGQVVFCGDLPLHDVISVLCDQCECTTPLFKVEAYPSRPSVRQLSHFLKQF